MKCKVDERALAKHFADSVWHGEYHHIDLDTIGKTMLSAIPRDAGFKVVLTGEGSDEHFSGYPFMAQDFLLEPDFSCPTSTLTKDVERRNEMRKTAEKAFARQAAILGFSGESDHGNESCWAYHQANKNQNAQYCLRPVLCTSSQFCPVGHCKMVRA